jgi:hypothetical protein
MTQSPEPATNRMVRCKEADKHVSAKAGLPGLADGSRNAAITLNSKISRVPIVFM